MNLPMKENGLRASAWPDRCAYCQAPLGEHKPDCVCLLRSVVLKLELEIVQAVPQSNDSQSIEFCRGGGSSYCMDNVLTDIEAYLKRTGDCACSLKATTTYLREADEDETRGWGLLGEDEH